MGVMYDKILGKLREGEGGEIPIGNTPKIFTTTDFDDLTDAQCREIRTGDIVVVSSNGVDYTCTVSTKTSGALYMYYIYGDTKILYRVKYKVANETWVFERREIIDLEIPQENAIPQSGVMKANTLYVLGELSSNTTFNLSSTVDNNFANVWMWTFETGATAPTITWPQGITAWNGGDPPVIIENYHYEISVLDGVASYIEAPLPVGGGE